MVGPYVRGGGGKIYWVYNGIYLLYPMYWIIMAPKTIRHLLGVALRHLLSLRCLLPARLTKRQSTSKGFSKITSLAVPLGTAALAAP